MQFSRLRRINNHYTPTPHTHPPPSPSLQPNPTAHHKTSPDLEKYQPPRSPPSSVALRPAPDRMIVTLVRVDVHPAIPSCSRTLQQNIFSTLPPPPLCTHTVPNYKRYKKKQVCLSLDVHSSDSSVHVGGRCIAYGSCTNLSAQTCTAAHFVDRDVVYIGGPVTWVRSYLSVFSFQQTPVLLFFCSAPMPPIVPFVRPDVSGQIEMAEMG